MSSEANAQIDRELSGLGASEDSIARVAEVVRSIKRGSLSEVDAELEALGANVRASIEARPPAPPETPKQRRPDTHARPAPARAEPERSPADAVAVEPPAPVPVAASPESRPRESAERSVVVPAASPLAPRDPATSADRLRAALAEVADSVAPEVEDEDLDAALATLDGTTPFGVPQAPRAPAVVVSSPSSIPASAAPPSSGLDLDFTDLPASEAPPPDLSGIGEDGPSTDKGSIPPSPGGGRFAGVSESREFADSDEPAIPTQEVRLDVDELLGTNEPREDLSHPPIEDDEDLAEESTSITSAESIETLMAEALERSSRIPPTRAEISDAREPGPARMGEGDFEMLIDDDVLLVEASEGEAAPLVPPPKFTKPPPPPPGVAATSLANALDDLAAAGLPSQPPAGPAPSPSQAPVASASQAPPASPSQAPEGGSQPPGDPSKKGFLRKLFGR